MVRAVFTVHDALVSTQENGLVGLNDLQVVETGFGPTLFATARGGGFLTGYDLGRDPGQTEQAGFWQIGPQYLQLESVDLVVRDGGDQPQLYLAGLVGAALRGVRLDHNGQGPLIEAQVAVTNPGVTLGQITEMALFEGTDQGLAALRGGGLIRVSFGADGLLGTGQIEEGPGLTNTYASDIVTATHNGQTYAFVSYAFDNTVAMYRQSQSGDLSYVGHVDAEVGLWVERPGAMTIATAADGGLYVVVAATGTDSLSVLSVTPEGMRVVDHVLDTRDTRFEAASHVTSVTIAGQSYVLAAGADAGLSLFVVLPGGRLQHLETFEATLAAPLNGITALEAMVIPGGLRVWVATEAAPFLSEFSISLTGMGLVDVAPDGGATMGGGTLDDVLVGGAGADSITAGGGNDILVDGSGRDTLRGGNGADTFIFNRDGAIDVIRDFDPTQDVIDLSGIGSLGGTNDLVVAPRSWGAFLRFGDEIIEVRSADGTTLGAADFGLANLITLGRVEVDPSLYPPPGEDPPPPDGGGGGAGGGGAGGGSGSPTQLPGPPPVFSGWIASPTFALDQGNASRTGTAAADNITTFGASDVVFGLFGNDTIRSGNGNDSISGDGGSDSIVSGNGSDLVLGGGGFDTIIAESGFDTLAGGNGADSIWGGNGNDVVLGGQGYDQIFGQEGHDSIWGGDTADRIYGGGGDDFLSAGTNFGITVDGVWGQAGNDVIYGNSGFDFLDGGAGHDTIDGGAQADNLYGRDGQDLLLGNAGLDRLFGGAGDDQLYGGAGNDGHFGEGGDDTLWGGAGNDRFFGGSGRDLISGGTGSDTIYAGSDFDTLVGGAGDDHLHGNFNADTFVFQDFHGHDVIADFDATNPFERLDLSAMSNVNSYEIAARLFEQSSNDVVVITGVNSSIRLLDVDLADLDPSDFIF